jgi:hypothetical protein
MAHAASDGLRGIADVLAAIRAFPDIQETRPGIFYVRRRPFLHFHVRGDARWADAKIGTVWGPEIPLPFDARARTKAAFVREVRARYEACATTGTKSARRPSRAGSRRATRSA